MASDRRAGRRGGCRGRRRWRLRRGPRSSLKARQLTRARLAVSVLFFANGALISTVIPRLPAIKADLGLSNGALGAAVAASALGALLVGPVAGGAVARIGSARLALATGVCYAGAIVLFGLVASWPALAATFALIGVLDVLMDVAMNAHGLRVQSGYDRSVFNTFHAWWSIGATAGGAVGAAAAARDIPLAVHLVGVGAALAAATVWSHRWLLAGPEPAAGRPMLRRAGGRAVLWALAPFAALSVAAAIVEDVPGSFGAVYLRDGLGSSPGIAGLSYVGFVAGLTVGRLGADHLVDRYGAAAVVQAGNLLAAVGLGIALLLGQPAAAVVGFTVVGLGASSTIPALFVAAGGAAGRAADGIALVSWATRVGFMASPVIVGVVADAAGLAVGVALCVAAAVVIAVTARRVMSQQPSAAGTAGC